VLMFRNASQYTREQHLRQLISGFICLQLVPETVSRPRLVCGGLGWDTMPPDPTNDVYSLFLRQIFSKCYLL